MDRPGPDSLVWQRLADDRGLLIGGATLLLQVADPTVGAGVEQHSNFKAEPWRRLYGTLVSLTTIVYGNTAEACTEVERLRAMHRPIRGTDSQGRTYAALRPAPWAWVHGTLAWAVIRLNEVFRTPFTQEEAEQYWREWLEVGLLLGVRSGDLPETYAGFLALIDEAALRGLEDNQSVRDVVASISVIPPPVWLRWLGPVWRLLIGRPAGSLSRLVTIGAIPPALAARLGLRLTEREQRRLRRFVALVAGVRRTLPPPLRPGPAALLIKWRSRRRWDTPPSKELDERATQGPAHRDDARGAGPVPQR